MKRLDEWRRRSTWMADLIAVVLAFACSATPGAAIDAVRPNILLIVIDTLRADRLGVYGDQRGLTPFLDGLAKTGVVFANAYAASSWTCPSVASLFTSRYPSQHGMNNFEAKLAADEVTLAELLTADAYIAGGFSANLRLTLDLGYGDGFTEWRRFGRAGTKVRGPVLRRESGSWLRPLIEQQKGPLLLYLQFMEPHAPYEPPEPYRQKFAVDPTREEIEPPKDLSTSSDWALEMLMSQGVGSKGLAHTELRRLASLYDGEVASVDGELRELFNELSVLGFLRNAIVIITADHGEEFGEHGQVEHGKTLFEPAIRVPLIMIAPGLPAGRVVPEVVTLVDVAPTIMELVGLAAPLTFEGRSLVSLAQRPRVAPTLWERWFGSAPTGEAISELEPTGGQVDARIHTHAIVRGTQKIIVTTTNEATAFDLSSDHEESYPGAVVAGSATAELRQHVDDRRAELRARASIVQQGPALDDATKEKLRALGYHP